MCTKYAQNKPLNNTFSNSVSLNAVRKVENIGCKQLANQSAVIVIVVVNTIVIVNVNSAQHKHLREIMHNTNLIGR